MFALLSKTSLESVFIIIPLAISVLQADTKSCSPSTSTTQILQKPISLISSIKHKVGILIPILSQAFRIVVPFFTFTGISLIVIVAIISS